MAEKYEDWPQRHRLAGGLHVQLTEAEANEWEEFARQRAEWYGAVKDRREKETEK